LQHLVICILLGHTCLPAVAQPLPLLMTEGEPCDTALASVTLLWGLLLLK